MTKHPTPNAISGVNCTWVLVTPSLAKKRSKACSHADEHVEQWTRKACSERSAGVATPSHRRVAKEVTQGAANSQQRKAHQRGGQSQQPGGQGYNAYHLRCQRVDPKHAHEEPSQGQNGWAKGKASAQVQGRQALLIFG
eukprot:CAMPEP_0202403404 /NCGR_PEP_ID=MMETSP1128-20130828/4930_1 /ASSEMBLY_ACC=CAM_ASM_000463 /TAXON_ID=3047 /ORGANISM="Dunaliella tertiolecta, Strain CCMP1320" /LENGTH=138 /DNA_ID=CAMNT_0049007661 /DNA_START=430 /DNA_END=846 /DNA_ORIENTATION=+